MYKTIKTLFLTCETPLHAGSGDSLGVVDLPIQRERHTGFPKIEASSLKGAIREAFELAEGNRRLEVIHNVFGPDEKYTDQEAHSGALSFSDSRLLLFPVKSVKGVFAYITCSKVLNRLKADLKIAKLNSMPSVPPVNSVCDKNDITIKEDKVILEEYTFVVKKDTSCSAMAKWLSETVIPQSEEYSYWKNKIASSLIVLDDNDFRDFVNLSTEVITRTKINNETGTVQDGALFTEEYLPSESILYSIVMASSLFVEDKLKGEFKQEGKEESKLVMDYFTSKLPEVFQLGGNATLGKGLLKARVI